MPDYTVSGSAVGKHGIALTANTESTVTFADDVNTVEVACLSASTDPVWFTVNNAAATVEGSATYFLFPGRNAARVDVPTAGPTVVRLISAAAATVSVTRA